jgi:hypothetical protein
MAHVTFIHGIGNKIEAKLLERAWIDALGDSGGPDIWSEGVTTSLCYWADVLYPSPLPAAATNTEAGGETDVTAAGEVDPSWYQDLPAEEQRQVRELAAEVGAISRLDEIDEDIEMPADGGLPSAADPSALAGHEAAAAAGTEFERVSVPGPLKRRLMRAFLRDVHHYLWDTEFSPRPREVFRVRREVRHRAVEAMTAATHAPHPHVVVGHSLGSVIAYDVLQNVDHTPIVDGLVTVGSPLGLDEVQDRLVPGWSRWNGYPAAKLTGPWLNVFDRLDPVCGFDPILANDFRRAGSEWVNDLHEPNWGTWRHAIGKYLRGQQLRTRLIDMLDLA